METKTEMAIWNYRQESIHSLIIAILFHEEIRGSWPNSIGESKEGTWCEIEPSIQTATSSQKVD
jgi:hypothetical protein